MLLGNKQAANKVTTLGEILVEIIAKEKGVGFQAQQHFCGPFASGAPAIFIDQIAKLGVDCAIAGSVGNDDFGKVCLNRLVSTGVDTAAINSDAVLPTAVAFVRYQNNGNRDFLYTIAGSAAEAITSSAIDYLLLNTTHFHVMGSSLSSTAMSQKVFNIVAAVKEKGGTISFDPNVRKELLDNSHYLSAFNKLLGYTDLFLPSSGEAELITSVKTEKEAINKLQLQFGISLIVLKRGELGATCFSEDKVMSVPAFRVNEIDPTGAGDCFGATFVACQLKGFSIEDSMRYACAAGACAVSTLGPMEGNSSIEQLDDFIKTRL